MDSDQYSGRVELLRRLATVAIILAALLSIITLVGWLSNVLDIARISSEYVPTAPSTAIFFLLLSAVLFFRGRLRSGSYRAAWPAMAALVLLACATLLGQFLVESISDYEPDIEQFLVQGERDPEGFTLGRMSPLTALMFILLSVSALMPSSKRGRSIAFVLAQATAAATLTTALLLLVGYAYDFPLLYGGEVVPVALPTATAFTLLSLAILLETRHAWLARWMTSTTVAGRITRAAVPAVAATIIVSGWIHQRTMIVSGAFDFSAIAIMTAAIATIIIVLTARRIQGLVDAGERALRERTDFAEGLVQSSSAWIWQTDADIRHTYTNRFVTTCLGYEPEEFLAIEKIEDLVHPEDEKRMMQIAKDAAEKGRTWSGEVLRWRHKNGSWRHIETSGAALFDDKGEFVGLQGVDQDITDRVQAEEELAESRRFIENIVEATPELLYIYDLEERRNIYANREIARLLGYSPEEVKEMGNKVFELLLHPDDAEAVSAHHARLASANEDVLELEYRMKSKPGTWRTLRSRDKVFLRAADGSARQIIGVVQDITERKRSEDVISRQARDLEVLLEASRIFTSKLDLDAALQNVVDVAIDLAELDTGAVYLLRGDELYLGATAPSLPDDFPEEMRVALLSEHAHIGEVVASCEAVAIADASAVELTDAEKAVVEARGLVSILYLPLVLEKRVLGALILGTTNTVRTFSRDEIDLFMALSTQAALAVENARLFDAIKEELEERSRAEQAIARSEERYRSVFEDTPVAIWEEDFSAGKACFDELRASGVTDLGRYLDDNPGELQRLMSLLRVIDVNEACVKVFRVNDKESLIKGMPALFTEESLEVFRGELIALFDGETSYESEAAMLDANGQRKEFEVSLKVQPGYEGTLARILISFVDITERKRSEQIVAARARLLEFAAAHTLAEVQEEILDEAENLTGSTIGFFHLVDEYAGRLTLQQWSTRTRAEFCQAEGHGMHYDIEEAGVWVDCIRERAPVIHNDYASLPHRKGMPEGHAEVVRELVAPVIRGGSIVAIIGVGNKISDYTDADAVMVTLLADLAWDISERQQADAALRESEERFRKIIETSPMGMHMYDLSEDGRLVFSGANPAADLILGIDNAQFVGKTIEDAFPPLKETEVPERYRNAARDNIPWYTEQIEYHEERISGAFEVYAFQTEPMKMVALFNDVTERRQAEEERELLREQLAQAQRMESVGRLAGGIAHDFNNMLGVIMGHVEIARTHLGPDDPLTRDLNEINKAARRSADLTRQLLAFARRQAMTPEVIDLDETLKGMIGMLRRLIGEDIELEWESRQDLWLVNMDPSQVDQLLANLLVNARDAIDGTGKVSITLDNVVVREVEAAAREGLVAGEYVKLTVSDSGRGIEPGAIDHIFEPFFTTKSMAEGTGLGLATVYGIVKQNDGYIAVESDPGRGTEFEVFLPRHEGDLVRAAPSEAAKPEHGTGERILLVEDEPTVLKMTETMLKRLGYGVISATGPEEALELARAETGSIDVLLTDVVMPGMSGRQLADELEGIIPEASVLFMSGYTADVISEHGVIDDGVNFLQKPFTSEKLSNALQQALGKGQE